MRKTFVVFALLLGGCNYSQPSDLNNTEKELELIVESPYASTGSGAQTRAYNPNNLRLEVMLDGEMAQTVTETDGSRKVIGTVNNTTFAIAVKWFEQVDGIDLQLTSFQGQRNAADGNSVVIRNSEYESTMFDRDKDGDSNLFERNNNTDPFNSNYCTSCRADIDVHINKISPSQAPTIDGQYDDIWSERSQFKDRNGDLFINDLLTVASDEYLNQNYTNGESPFRWAAMHDGTYLYMLILGEQSPHQTPSIESANFEGDNITVSVSSGAASSEQFKSYTFYLSDQNGVPYSTAALNSDTGGTPARRH